MGWVGGGLTKCATLSDGDGAPYCYGLSLLVGLFYRSPYGGSIILLLWIILSGLRRIGLVDLVIPSAWVILLGWVGLA